MLSNKLKQLRNTTKLTQAEFAKKINVARTTYAMYEQGHRDPDYETLVRIADFFDVTTDYLLGRDEKIVESVFETPTYMKLGIPKSDYDNLTAYQHEVLDWSVSQKNLHFKNQSDNVLDMMERLEIIYEYEMSKKDQ